MGREKAKMVFTDPPYNVAIAGHASGLGRAQHQDFMFASGEMTKSEFAEFLETALGNSGFRIDRWVSALCVHGLAPSAGAHYGR